SLCELCELCDPRRVIGMDLVDRAWLPPRPWPLGCLLAPYVAMPFDQVQHRLQVVHGAERSLEPLECLPLGECRTVQSGEAVQQLAGIPDFRVRAHFGIDLAKMPLEVAHQNCGPVHALAVHAFQLHLVTSPAEEVKDQSQPGTVALEL